MGTQQELSLKEYLSKQLRQDSDLLGIAISDRDGVPIVQEWSSHAREIQSKFTNNSQIAAAFSNMSEQANKLGIGASDVFIASYEKHQIIQFNELATHQCIITLFTKADCNIGELIDKRDVWRKAAQVIDQQVLSALRHTVMT